MSETGAPARLGSSKSSLPGLQTASFSLCPRLVQGESPPVPSPSYRPLTSRGGPPQDSLQTSSLPKAPPQPHHSGGGALTYGFAGDADIQSAAPVLKTPRRGEGTLLAWTAKEIAHLHPRASAVSHPGLTLGFSSAHLSPGWPVNSRLAPGLPSSPFCPAGCSILQPSTPQQPSRPRAQPGQTLGDRATPFQF